MDRQDIPAIPALNQPAAAMAGETNRPAAQ
jgi:hypothetical protein